ncbi:MAG: hypothetical protein U0K65_01795 [Negativibacillus sp.]|nr:hypothetical protein [Negativibacillus sp.]
MQQVSLPQIRLAGFGLPVRHCSSVQDCWPQNYIDNNRQERCHFDSPSG